MRKHIEYFKSKLLEPVLVWEDKLLCLTIIVEGFDLKINDDNLH